MFLAIGGPGVLCRVTWGVAGKLGAPPEALREGPRGSLGGSRKVGVFKARLLGRFVITHDLKI